MKIRILLPWKQYKPGFVMETTAGVADLLVNRRKINGRPVAEYVVQGIETMVPVYAGAQMVPDAPAHRRKGR